MNSEAYTPGHGSNASDFMARRSLRSHGQFFRRHLQAGASVLDCGCGPGSITLGIAAQVDPGRVVGIDFCESQIASASSTAARRSIKNVAFQTADCYALPFEQGSFDRVFSHALFEHLARPADALREINRVLKPGGVVGLCSPDWGGFILAPSSKELTDAVAAYTDLQTRNGGDVQAGRKLGHWLAGAGFEDINMSARYECYPSIELIADYLAVQLERKGDERSARTFRKWSQSGDGLFAQAWVCATGHRKR